MMITGLLNLLLRSCLASLHSITPATPAKKIAKHPNSKTPWSCQLHAAVVQMGVEFWSTYFAAPKPPLLNLLVEFVGNYPPLPSITQKTVRFLLFLPSRTSTPRLPPLVRLSAAAPPSVGPPPPSAGRPFLPQAAALPCRLPPLPQAAALPCRIWIPALPGRAGVVDWLSLLYLAAPELSIGCPCSAWPRRRMTYAGRNQGTHAPPLS
ncbi:hypothetical protein C2845_PM17G05920 [Panicum miliaceum]|uniref:Uncharacterized protein n=1 Tax=Panicum miliaceum TaxID=4540 RepID=A0A3L6Q2D8_PANMI|nr:hypothetical protein C2845_PM17G05920 [Panicum miliaceum]